MKRQFDDDKGSLDLIEAAFQLVRSTPVSALATYYIGTLPFMLALLYFWSDMSGGIFAEQRLATGASALCLLFIWMKCWQAAFARKLLARLTGEPVPRWDAQRIMKTIAAQTALQPWGLFLLPASVVVLFPFGWVFAFYQNAVVFGAGDDGLKTTFRKSWQQMKLWPAQNHCVLMAFKLFGLFVLLNVLLAALGVPFLAKGLLGVETAFSQSWLAALNTTFFATVIALTYLCLDPVIKATYVVRCFQGESLQSAEDLRAGLRARGGARQLAGMAAVMLLFASVAFGGEPATPAARPVTGPALERSISEVIQQREYTWRMPREKAPLSTANLGWLERQLKALRESFKAFFQKVFAWVQKVIRWLTQNRRANAGAGGSSVDWYAVVKVLLILLCVALLVFLAMIVLRFWRDRNAPGEVVAEALTPVPDIQDENTGAEQLPEDGWLRMARELFEAGDLRLALRAYYLASLAHLADRNLITIARYKSNRDYERELDRRAHAVPSLLALFRENVTTFDRVWYGLHEVTRELLEGFASNVTRIKTN
jgi:hypothetical protein